MSATPRLARTRLRGTESRPTNQFSCRTNLYLAVIADVSTSLSTDLSVSFKRLYEETKSVSRPWQLGTEGPGSARRNVSF